MGSIKANILSPHAIIYICNTDAAVSSQWSRSVARSSWSFLAVSWFSFTFFRSSTRRGEKSLTLPRAIAPLIIFPSPTQTDCMSQFESDFWRARKLPDKIVVTPWFVVSQINSPLFHVERRKEMIELQEPIALTIGLLPSSLNLSGVWASQFNWVDWTIEPLKSFDSPCNTWQPD